jgi:putative transposase
VLGIDIGDSEDEVFWTEFLSSLRQRGLAGVELVVSDAHLGLKAAIAKVFIGASWQRCRVHFMRNVLARVQKAQSQMVAALIRTIFAQADQEAVDSQLDEVALRLEPKFPDVATMLLDARADVCAFASFPRAHWTKIWSTNSIERLNAEIKRRTRVVGIFPNDASALRLITAVCVETHEEWLVAEKRYMSEGSMALLTAADGPPALEVTLATT